MSRVSRPGMASSMENTNTEYSAYVLLYVSTFTVEASVSSRAKLSCVLA